MSKSCVNASEVIMCFTRVGSDVTCKHCKSFTETNILAYFSRREIDEEENHYLLMWFTRVGSELTNTLAYLSAASVTKKKVLERNKSQLGLLVHSRLD